MIARAIERALWLVSALVTIGASLLTPHDGVAVSASSAVPLPPALFTSPTRNAVTRQDEVHEIISDDLFRRERSAAEAPITAPATGLLHPPSPPKPRLVLRGLVGGPPWDAILDGVPGHEGSFVVRAGDTVGGLRIRAVLANEAIVQGMDTSWVLKWSAKP